MAPPWSSSYRSRNMEVETVRRGNGGVSRMFVGRSKTRQLDLPVFTELHTRRTKKEKSSTLGSWWNDPETRRRRRVAKYRLYSAEGKLKASLKQGILRWIKHKCSNIARRF